MPKFKIWILLSIIIACTMTMIQGNRFINCRSFYDRNNAYINEYAWYECDTYGQERLRYCIICDSPYSPLSGSYISRDALTSFGFWRGRNEEQLGNFCNELQLYGCNNIRNQIDGEFDIYEGDFCGNVLGQMKRWIRNRQYTC